MNVLINSDSDVARPMLTTLVGKVVLIDGMPTVIRDFTMDLDDLMLLVTSPGDEGEGMPIPFDGIETIEVL